MRWLVVVAAVSSGCIESSIVTCDDGRVCPENYTCDDAHGGCASPAQLGACANMADGTLCNTSATGDSVCDRGVCVAVICGDGVRSPSESCDGDQFSTINNCMQLGYYDNVPLSCTACSLDESVCTGTCGDLEVNGDELCDGAPPTESCIDLGFIVGTLGCATTCGPDFEDCVPFGWRIENTTENLYAIHGTSSSNVWIAGRTQHLRRFDGTQWNTVDVPCATGDLRAVFALSDTDVFLAETGSADSALIRKTSTECTRYVVPSDLTNGRLWATSLTLAYVGGDNGVYKFDGTTTLTQVTTGSVEALWGSGPSDIYAGSVFTDEVQHYDGQNWTPITVGSLAGVASIWGTGPNDVYIGGLDGSFRARIEHKSTSALTWDPVLDDVPRLGNGQTAAGSGNKVNGRLYIVGASFTGRSYVMMSDGSGWVDLDAPSIEAGNLYAAPDGKLFVIPYNQTKILTFDGTARVNTALLAPTGKLAAAGAHTAYSLYNRTLYVWDGNTWSTELGNSVDDMFVASNGDLYVVGTVIGVRKRTRAGVYSTISTMTGQTLIHGTADTDLWVSPGGNNLSITHLTAGTPVTTVLSTIPNHSGLPRKILAVAPNLVFVLQFSGPVMRWNGSQWDAMPTPISATEDGYGSAPDDVYAWNQGAGLIHFDGTAWSLLAVPSPEQAPRDVWGTKDSLFVAGGLGLHYFDGQSWSRVDTGDAFDVNSIDGFGDSLYLANPAVVRQIVRTTAW